MALKPLFLDEKLVNRILCAAREAGKPYWDFLKNAPGKKRRKTKTVTVKKARPRKKAIKPKRPEKLDGDIVTPFPPPTKPAPTEPPTVDPGESGSMSSTEARASCSTCGGEVILPRDRLLRLRSAGRRVYCTKHTPPAAKSA